MNQVALNNFLNIGRQVVRSQRHIKRFYSSSFLAENLHDRALIRVAGREASELLQGIVTNDMNLLDNGSCNVLYSMLLNRKGRVLFDLLIHRKTDGEEYIVECDRSARENVMRVLRLYKLRKKLEISPIDDMNVWSILEDSPNTMCQQSNLIEEFKKASESKYEGIYLDPRLSNLGARLHASNTMNIHEICRNIKQNGDERPYTKLRYQLGVPEGVDDLPYEKALPLECNLDFFHGVSFNKGCYVGQELTARIHHTGVIRKRLMPIKISNYSETEVLQSDSAIENENKKVVGKFRSNTMGYGLALIRLKEAFTSQTLKLMPYNLEIVLKKPIWWPSDKELPP